jgi:hypothetical protein
MFSVGQTLHIFITCLLVPAKAGRRCLVFKARSWLIGLKDEASRDECYQVAGGLVAMGDTSPIPQIILKTYCL